MSVIKSTKARQVFDSRGLPTVEAEIVLSDGSVGQSIVPSGASTGSYEAHELRDKSTEYLKKGVLQAVKNINLKINKAIKNTSVFNQKKIDQILIELDGTENKKKIRGQCYTCSFYCSCKSCSYIKKNTII